MSTSIDISIVVPVYNGAKSIEELCERVIQTEVSLHKSFEIILVDDYSKDNSWQTIQRLQSKHQELIKGVRLSYNSGQHNATLCGIGLAKGNFIVTIDDDLEFSPEDIPILLQKQEQSQAGVVYGIARARKQHFIRKFLSSLYKKSSRLFDGEDKGKGSSFRLMTAELAKAVYEHTNIFSFIDEFILWHTRKIESVEVHSAVSKRGKSRYSLFGLIFLVKELTFFNSVALLRFISYIGMTMMVINFCLGAIIIFRKLMLSIHVEGYTSLIVAILFSSGLIIFSLGVIAEYISKLIKMQYRQPPYKIDTII